MDNIITWLKTPLANVAGVPISPGLIAVVLVIVWFVTKRR